MDQALDATQALPTLRLPDTCSRTAAGTRSRRSHALAATAAALGLLLSGCGQQQPAELTLFQDVTQSAGLSSYAGMTHGTAWGDYDGDGLPDLYATNHLNAAQLWRNLGGGKFADMSAEMFTPEQTGRDKHGAAWADFDNDGRLDLVQLTGAVMGVGAQPKRLLHNLGGSFEDVAATLGVANPEGRTRMPLWFDLNADGRLDLFEGAEKRLDDKVPPRMYLQGATGFAPADASLPLRTPGAPFCVLSTLTGDDKPALVCRLMDPKGAVQVLDLSTVPAKTLDLLPQTAFEDIAAADFDNDGRVDLLLARKNPAGAVAFGRPAQDKLVASVSIDQAHVERPMGFSFRSKGPLQIKLAAQNQGNPITPQRVHLGQAGAHPAGLYFTVGPEVGAAAASVPGGQPGVYVGFTAPDQWTVHVTASRAALASGQPKVQDLQFGIAAAQPIDKVEAVGPTQAEAAPLRLFMNQGDRLVEQSDPRGLNKPAVSAVNVVAADFDNDMHVDLFVLASGEIGAHPNLLLLNDDNGHFRPVKNAGGANGPLAGVGDSVTTVDFDGDGFVDLLTSSGGSMGRSLGLPAEAGGYRLYRNVAANGNHWLEIDLEGTKSNRDGIGAVVRATAGGVTQMRVQDGGVHERGQNHARLHFGLAKNTTVDKLTIHWPSGTVQELRDVKANQVLRVREPAAP